MDQAFQEKTQKVLNRLGITNSNPGAATGQKWMETRGDLTNSVSPIDGEVIATVNNAAAEDYEMVITPAEKGFLEWKTSRGSTGNDRYM